MWQAWGRREVFTGFWLGDLKVRPPGRPKHRWEDNIKLDLRETGINGVNWIPLGQDRASGRLL
jgi:hypothetical protein